VLHGFTGNDGASPGLGAWLVFDQSGALYGTTSYGGDDGYGTVFILTPPAILGGAWTERVLHSFTGTPDGANPSGHLVFDQSGALYGTTANGGASGLGTVFKLTPPSTPGGAWTAAVLYSFTGSDGANPTGAGVIFDGSGALYGTSRNGGTDGNGTVFQLTPPKSKHGAWTESVLHDFTEVNDGGAPVAGLTFDRSGALYGTTYFGFGNPNFCGTVFKLAPPARKHDNWTETVLHDFNCSDGANPFAGVILISQARSTARPTALMRPKEVQCSS
jgi:uncharacterized repeat protein (TIGR03803 family)